MTATHWRPSLSRARLGLPAAHLGALSTATRVNRLGLLTTLLALLVSACGPTPSSSGTMTPGTTNVTSFHLSILNACAEDVVLLVGTSASSGRKVLLFKKARDTVSGTNEAVFLLDGNGEALAMYQPIQGNQRLTVSADCTDLRKDL